VIDDTTAPVADASSLADVTAQCSVTSLTAPTATDNCAGSVTVTNNASLPITTQGTTVVTWTYTDENGNTTTQDQNIVIDDTTAPVADASSLADVTAQCSVTSLTAPTATDNCAGSVTVTNNASLPITTQGTTVVTWTYTDENGNTTTQDQNIVIDDTTAPVADASSLADVTAQCSVTSLTAPTATDNCAGSVTVTNNASLPITTQGTTVVTWTYTDENGNTTTQDQNIVIDDTTAPVADASSLADVTAQCSVTSLTAPTATDNCAGSVTVTNNASLPITTQGTTVVTWTYTDENGNTTTQDQNIVIDDTTAPVADASSLADVTAQCSVTSLTAPTATDNCAGSVTVTNNASLPITTQGTTVVTWTYTDENGNTTTQDQNIVIDDTTAPVADASSLADVTAQCSVTSLTAPTATDNCAGSVTVTNNASLPITTQGTTVVTWTYTDENGNTTTQDQNIVIDDTTAPVADASSLADVTAQCSVTSLTAPTATDNCAGSVTVTNNASLPITTQGTTVVTWTYTDENGNTTTQDQNIVIDDTTAPVADASSLADVTAQCSVTSLTAPTATDNCAGSVTVTNNASLPITTQGTTVVTWTYTDENGNTTTQDQNIVIDDTTAPVADASSLADVTAQCSVTSLTAPTATDNCAGSVTVTNNASLPITTQGTTVVTWTFD
jgi:urease accessory protein UreH